MHITRTNREWSVNGSSRSDNVWCWNSFTSFSKHEISNAKLQKNKKQQDILNMFDFLFLERTLGVTDIAFLYPLCLYTFHLPNRRCIREDHSISLASWPMQNVTQ